MSVAERARPSPRRGRNASREGSSRFAISSRRRFAAALLVEEVRVEAGVDERRALLRGDCLVEQVVDGREGVGDRLLLRALDQAGELDQLEEAGNRPGDIDVGVEPRLAELAAGAPGLLEHLVLDHPVGRLHSLGGAEELLPLLLLGGIEDGARPRRRGRVGRCPTRSRRAARGRARRLRGSSPCRGGDAPPPRAGAGAADLRRHHRRAGGGGTGDRAGLKSDDVHPRELETLRPLERHDADRVGHRSALLVHRRDAGLGDGDQISDEVAVRSGRLAPDPIGRQLAEPGEVAQRSAASGWAANSRWRRKPIRSISRRTKTSARISAIARAAAR